MRIFHILFICSSVENLGCFCFLTIVNNVSINMGLQTSVQVLTFTSFGNKPHMELHGNSIFNFLRNCHTVFLSSCTILHSHHQSTKIPNIPATLLTHYFLFFFLIVAILICVKWYFVILICISLVGKECICNAGDPSSIPGSGRSPGERIGYPLQYYWASLVAQLVKNPPATWETWVRSHSWEDPLEKGKATHSRILAWRIPWTI